VSQVGRERTVAGRTACLAAVQRFTRNRVERIMATKRDARKRTAEATSPSGRANAIRRTTLADVAKEAGVSVSAVSKVVRDAYGVSPEMTANVTAAIKHLGYRPHAGARTLRGRSFTIGVMLTELSSPFQPEIAQGVSDELASTPYQGILVAGGVTPDRQKEAIEAMTDRQVDGLVVIAPWMDIQWLEGIARRVPTVVVARHGASAHFDSVIDDDYFGAQLMVDHLVSLGHRTIAHTSLPSGGLKRPFILSHTARRDGYEAAMRSHGLEPDVIVTAWTEEGGHQAAAEALDRPEPPTAIFAGADIAALGSLRAAEERGLRVPEDVTVVGYDDIFVSGLGRVSLTTIDQSGQSTGVAAVRLLLERIEGRTHAVRHVVTPRLVVRGTSGPPLAD
jgi:LacI family transcriptional regulator